MSSIQLSDREMLRILRDRTNAGLEVRIVGSATRDFHARDLSRLPLHTIRDGEKALIGSESLRSHERDDHREIGVTARDPEIVKRLEEIFESDWRTAQIENTAAGLTAPPNGAGVIVNVIAHEIQQPHSRRGNAYAKLKGRKSLNLR